MRLSSMTSIGVAWRKKVQESVGVQQADIGLPAALGEPIERRLEHVGRFGTVPVEQRRAGHAREHQLEVVDGREAIGVLLLDRLALLGDAQVAVQRRGAGSL